jgi:hypothetical protein
LICKTLNFNFFTHGIDSEKKEESKTSGLSKSRQNRSYEMIPAELKFYWEGALAGVEELHRNRTLRYI